MIYLREIKIIDKYTNEYSKLEEIISENKDDVKDILLDNEISQEEKNRLIILIIKRCDFISFFLEILKNIY